MRLNEVCFISCANFLYDEFSLRKVTRHNLKFIYCRGVTSPNIVRVIKSKGMKWSERMESMGDTRNAYKIVRKFQRRRPHG